MVDGLTVRREVRSRSARWRWYALCAAILVLWFGCLELRGLYFPDEGRYAEIPAEMLHTGDWLTPRLNGVPYFEKPPLQYWATAAVFAAAGEDEWTARFAPALVGFLAVIAVLLTARRLFSRRAGWMAAAVLGSSLGFFAASQFVTLDMMLTALMTAGLCAFLVAQDSRTCASSRRSYMLGAWALIALAVLTKGIVALVLPVLALLAYVALTRDLALLRHLHALPGLAVFGAIALPWFVLVELRNPGFAEFFFIHEHLQRFAQAGHQRPGPWWYFVPILAGFLLPWLPALVPALVGRGSPRPPGFDPQRFAWCSVAAILVFFSVSSSKLPAYVLPAMGAVALAACAPLARRITCSVRIAAWTLVLGGVTVGIAAGWLTSFIRIDAVRDEVRLGAAWVYGAAAILAAGGGGAVLLLRGKKRLRALAAVVVTGLLAVQVGGGVAFEIDDYYSAERLVERVTGGEAKRPFRPEAGFYSVDMFDHTVPFYLGRTLTLVHDESELAWGLARGAPNYIRDLDEFEVRWRAERVAYAIMRLSTYEALATHGLPMHVLGRDARRVLVARGPDQSATGAR